jgi:hypothetical protein
MGKFLTLIMPMMLRRRLRTINAEIKGYLMSLA